jgi:HEAT repeat protein
MWSCPRCGEQMDSGVELCSRCGLAPSMIPIPPKRCPACGTLAEGPALEGKLRCPHCLQEFEDYEEWVRRCRAAAWAATRPAPPEPEEPPPRPPHLRPLAASLLAMAAFYAVLGLRSGHGVLVVLCLALALLQSIAGVSLLLERKHADVLVRIAAGFSALLPLYLLPVLYFVGLYGFFSRPLVVKYFGGRANPMPDRIRHPLIAWLLVLVSISAALFAGVVAEAQESVRRWNDNRSFLMDLAYHLSAFFSANRWWAPAGVLGGLSVLALWGKVNRAAFLTVSILAIIGVIATCAPPVVEAWFYEASAREADSYLGERDVQRLVWGAREPDPKVRLASMRAMDAVGRSARVAVPALVHGLKDADRRVRLAAACALAQFEPSVEGAMTMLIAALEDDRTSEEEADRAAVALGHFGPRARPALSLLLDRLRRGDSATMALAEMGPAAVPGLTEALMEKDAKVRRRAARALRLLGPAARSAVPLLIDRLKDADVGVRTEAAYALGEIHREKAIPLLRDLLRDDKSVSKAAADALCALGQRDVLGELPQGCSSMNALRQPAIWDHLSRAVVEKDVEGSGTEVLVELAERAVMCAEVLPEAADRPALLAFRRVHASSRKRSVLEILTSLDVDFVLESDRIRILSPEQARSFWTEWLAESRKKRE